MFHNSLHTQANRERIIATQQTGAKLPLRRELEIALTVYINKARAARKEKQPKMQASADKMVLDLQEQLTLLDAIEFGFIESICKNDKPRTK